MGKGRLVDSYFTRPREAMRRKDIGGAAALTVIMCLAAYAAVGLLILACLAGCTRTVYEPVERVKTEMETVTRWRTDTVIQGDTRFIYIKGDTVIDWRDRWRDRTTQVHDTLYVERTDSVPVPYPVERELSHWERTKVDYGGYAMVLLGAVIAVAVIWLIKKIRK